MSQNTRLGTHMFMQTAPQQSKTTQKSTTRHVLFGSTSTSCSSTVITDIFATADLIPPNMAFAHNNTSGSFTPNSPQSVFSYESHASSASSISIPKPERSSLKHNLKSSESTRPALNRKSTPSVVRFADAIEKHFTAPELTNFKLNVAPRGRPKAIRAPKGLIDMIPDVHKKAQYYEGLAFISPTAQLSKQINGTQSQSATETPNARRPVSVPAPQTTPALSMKKRVKNRAPGPTSPQEPDPRWANIPLPDHYTPPAPAPKPRVASYQSIASVVSYLSTESAPTIVETSRSVTAPAGQYNPLEHYIPCLYPSCNAHYTPAHLGPSFYLPSGPYSLSRLHAYCPRHAVLEINEAGANCKRKYEQLRQNAGRRTLGVIAAEFEALKQDVRSERQSLDAKLSRQQKRRVLGASAALSEKSNDNFRTEAWDWRYTQRPCINANCTAHYTPYSNHLYTFYRTPQTGTSFFPQQTFCPRCAKSEVEELESRVKEKWASRCGWDKKEWQEWFGNVIKDRTMEQEYWIKAQERVVREKGPAKWVSRLEDDLALEDKGMKKNVFKRWFASVA
ncbi:hypothetical protein DDE83_001828 [Stemphylium lycopersici]|uniref:Uncharacterized protein n=1 Tax=Stemphylium lycopersici TaxID=183478 RepID=A0A364NC07_STELY|nr:hypothetical protein DDE83_001828 [Stemphylium lycopersici]